MKKKIWLGLSSLILVFAVGTTAAFALGDGDKEFQKVFPQIKEMHPDFSDKQVQDMYDSCHLNKEMTQHMSGADMNNMMKKNT